VAKKTFLLSTSLDSPFLDSSFFRFFTGKEISRRRAEDECKLFFSWIFSRILWPNCLDLRAQNNWLAPVKPLRLHDSRISGFWDDSEFKEPNGRVAANVISRLFRREANKYRIEKGRISFSFQSETFLLRYLDFYQNFWNIENRIFIFRSPYKINLN